MSFEETLRQIVREEIREAMKSVSATQDVHGEYPPVLNVKQAADLLHVCTKRVYEMKNIPGFPYFQEVEGGKIKIPTKRLIEWVENNYELINDSA